MQKRNKGIIIFTTILLCLILAISPVFAQVGMYEFNDFILYRIGGTAVTQNAFRSQSSSLSQFYIIVGLGAAGIHSQWMITSGTMTDIPYPTGYDLDKSNFGSQAYVIVNGSRINFVQDEQNGRWITASPITTTGYPVVYVYFPYVASSGQIPSTPVAVMNGNQLTWTPTGYNARVLYNSSGTGIWTTLTDTGSSPYTVTDEGFYKVQLWYTNSGSTYITSPSNPVEYAGQSSDNTGILQRIVSFIQNLVVNVSNAISSVGSFISQLGDIFSDLLAFMPEPYGSVVWSLATLLLIFGLFRLI